MEKPQAYELQQLGCPPTPVADCQDQGKEVKKRKEKTTVMLRNLPNNYSREMFLEMLDNQGLKGLYDFAYLPCDFYRDAARLEPLKSLQRSLRGELGLRLRQPRGSERRGITLEELNDAKSIGKIA